VLEVLRDVRALLYILALERDDVGEALKRLVALERERMEDAPEERLFAGPTRDVGGNPKRLGGEEA
jgi:hypothetical protein